MIRVSKYSGDGRGPGEELSKQGTNSLCGCQKNRCQQSLGRAGQRTVEASPWALEAIA